MHTTDRRRRLLDLGLLLFLLSAPAAAGDYYVDALNGDDGNSGGAPDDAWKTLSHAVPSLPGGKGHVLHVAPGVYDPALGESFPIQVGAGLTIVGDQGRTVTRVDGDGASALFALAGEAWTSYAAETRFEGLWLEDAVIGVEGMNLGSDVSCAFALREGILSDMTGAGVRARVTNLFFDNDTITLRVELDDVLVEDCAIGVEVEADSTDFGFSDAHASAGGSEFRNCGTGLTGTSLHQAEAWATVGAGGSLFVDNGTGMSAEALSASRCVFVGNVLGLRSWESGGSVDRCTFFGNGTGIRGPWLLELTVTNSILWGNGDDLSGTSEIHASYCDIGDGDFEGLDGNLSADPLFISAPGDLALGHGSPCIDAGDPGSSLDPDGTRADMGAFPYTWTGIGSSYCVANANSTGVPASLSVLGSSALADNWVRLRTTDLPANQFGYYLTSDVQDFVPLFGGSAGNLCLGVPIVRFSQPPKGAVLFSGDAGAMEFMPDLTNLPNQTVFLPGAAWNFQLWFRDGSTSNTSAGVEVTWQ